MKCFFHLHWILFLAMWNKKLKEFLQNTKAIFQLLNGLKLLHLNGISWNMPKLKSFLVLIHMKTLYQKGITFIICYTHHSQLDKQLSVSQKK